MTYFLFLYSIIALPQDRYIVHVSSEAGGFIPNLIIANTGSTSAAKGDLVLYEKSGQEIRKYAVNIQPGETYYASPFFLSNSNDVSHIKIIASDDLLVSTTYQSIVEGTSPVHVHESSVQSKRWLFYQGNWNSVWDGIAVLNVNSTATEIRITQYVSSNKIKSTTMSLAANEKGLLVLADHFDSKPGSFFELECINPVAFVSLRGTLDRTYIWENLAVPLSERPASQAPFEMVWQTQIDRNATLEKAGLSGNYWYYVEGSGTVEYQNAYRLNLTSGGIEKLTLEGDVSFVTENNGDIFYVTDRDSIPNNIPDWDNVALNKYIPGSSDQKLSDFSFLPHIGLIDNQFVFLQDRNCSDINGLSKLNRNTGSVVWNITFPNCSVIDYFENQIFIASSSNKQLLAIDRSSGSTLFQWGTDGYIDEVDGNTIYGVVDRDNRVFKGDLTGNILWEYDTAFNEAFPKACSAGLVFYVYGKPSGKRDLVMIRKSDGTEIWKKEDFLPSPAIYAVWEDYVLVSVESTLYQINQSSGEIKFQLNTENSYGIIGRSSFFIHEGFIYLVSFESTSGDSVTTITKIVMP